MDPAAVRRVRHDEKGPCPVGHGPFSSCPFRFASRPFRVAERAVLVVEPEDPVSDPISESDR